MEEHSFVPQGVCCKKISVIIDPDTGLIKDLNLTGGCPGGHEVLRKILIGKKLHEVKDLFRGLKCGNRATSCADQVSIFLNTIK